MRLSFQRLLPAIVAMALLWDSFSTALAEDNTVTLCDQGVRNIPGRLVIGSMGSNNALIVTGGAVVNSAASETGLRGTHNRVLVSGANSCWSNEFSFKVGVSGGWNEVVVADGGRLVNSSLAVIGDNTGNPGNRVVITGPGSTWHNRSGLTVGWGGRFSSFTVSNGAQVFNKHAVIGRDTMAVLNSVVVSGEGSLWRNDGLVVLGVYGANNRLKISARAVVTATSLRTLSPGNVIEIAGGHLFLTNHPQRAVQETTLMGVPWREIDFSNSFRLEHSTTLAFELESSHAGNALPFVVVNGPVALDGDLVIRLADAFQASPDAVFTLMKFSTPNGRFRNVSSGERIATADQSGSFRVLISESVLLLTDFQPSGPLLSRRQVTPEDQRDSSRSDLEAKPPIVPGAGGVEIIPVPAPGPALGTLPALPKLQCVVRDAVLGLEFPWNPQRTYRLWVSTSLQAWTEISEPVFEFPSPGLARWRVEPAPNAAAGAGIQIFRLSVK
jgi:T5SS/PEP-CTERM-associated repeat protein